MSISAEISDARAARMKLFQNLTQNGGLVAELNIQIF